MCDSPAVSFDGFKLRGQIIIIKILNPYNDQIKYNDLL